MKNLVRCWPISVLWILVLLLVGMVWQVHPW